METLIQSHLRLTSSVVRADGAHFILAKLSQQPTSEGGSDSRMLHQIDGTQRLSHTPDIGKVLKGHVSGDGIVGPDTQLVIITTAH